MTVIYFLLIGNHGFGKLNLSCLVGGWMGGGGGGNWQR